MFKTDFLTQSFWTERVDQAALINWAVLTGWGWVRINANTNGISGDFSKMGLLVVYDEEN